MIWSIIEDIWSIFTVMISESIIIMFLVPALAAFIFAAEIWLSVSEERHKKKEIAERKYFLREAAGPFCPWEGEHRKAA